jgi:hypothetical protein
VPDLRLQRWFPGMKVCQAGEERVRNWLRRIRGGAVISLIWAGAGFAVGGLFELIDNIVPGALPFIRAVDMWPQTLAIIFFLGAVVFTLLLAITERNRRFEELSLGRFAAWGAVAGLVLGAVLGAPPMFMAITTIGSSVAAAGSLALARLAAKRDEIGPGQSGLHDLPSRRISSSADGGPSDPAG